MFRSGRRLFSAASLALIGIAILHSIGTFAPGPVDPSLERLASEMRAHRPPLGLAEIPFLLALATSSRAARTAGSTGRSG